MYRLTIVLLLIVGISCSTNNNTNLVKVLGEAQGTYYSITYYDSQNRNLKHEIDSILDAFDQSVSLWVPNSILSDVNNNKENVKLDSYFIDNFNLSQQVAEETNGDFDATVGAIVKAWGFGYNDSINVDSTIIDSLLNITGYEKISIIDNKIVKQNKNITLDFNAIAQGYSVDVIGDFLESRNINNYLVDVGGEVKGKGTKPDNKPWKVGIEKPAQNSNSERILTAVIKLQNQSIATSGNYRKYYIKDGIKYSHTINPHTGYPAKQNLLSASIVTNNTALADAYATSCMVMGLDKSIQFIEKKDGVEAFFIYSNDNGDYEFYSTEGFNKLITKEFK